MLTNVIGGQNGARVAERKCGGLESHCPFGDAQVQILPLALRSPPSLPLHAASFASLASFAWPGCGRGIPWDCGSQDPGSNPGSGPARRNANGEF